MKHSLLYARNGENVTTSPDPIGVVIATAGTLVTYLDPYGTQKTVDLDTVGTFCRAWDDDGLTTARVYSVGEIDLPDWLPASEWIRSRTEWKWVWGYGVDPSWPESWQRGLHNLRGAQLLTAVKLLKTRNFRSEFRKSMRNQIIDWLQTPVSMRRFHSPLSDRQWGAVIGQYDRIEAKRTDEHLYHQR